ncbi:hypothetical protein RJ639_017997 [Escallonia herrerae]|uniref:Pentatricopeptide repeat-containing protein n=1 Tax=Escallonia herrerae TaxID=1293975 RepID=A0AA88VAN7_9ASTE|nr:hypothetical protein RJ639_017997 [Escallonia herrerae]
MAPCFCSLMSTPVAASTSIYKFISDQPYLSLLETKCTTMQDLQKIQAQLIKTGLAKDPIAASRVLAFCATSPAGNINYAHLLFTQIETPNLFVWNTIIRGFSQSSTPQIAISLFVQMLVTSPIQPTTLTYPSLFKVFAQLGLARNGAQLHGRVIKLGLQADPYIRNTLLHMYINMNNLSAKDAYMGLAAPGDIGLWQRECKGDADALDQL